MSMFKSQRSNLHDGNLDTGFSKKDLCVQTHLLIYKGLDKRTDSVLNHVNTSPEFQPGSNTKSDPVGLCDYAESRFKASGCSVKVLEQEIPRLGLLYSSY